MTRLSKLDVECAVPLGVRDELQPPEVDAILEVVFLAASADGMLADEEADAFIRIMLRLFGQHATPDRIRGVMQQIAARVQRGDSCQAARCARVGELTPALQRVAPRELAYKLAYVMLMSDLETNEDEFNFDLELRRILGISNERAEVLTDEAAAAVLGAPSSKGRGAPVCAGDPPSQIVLPFDDPSPGAASFATRGTAAKRPSRKAVSRKPSRKAVSRKPSRKAVARKPSRKAVSRKPSRKAVARKPARKAVARKPAKKVPAKQPSRRRR